MVAAFLSAITFQLGSLIVYLGFQVYRWYDRGFTDDKSKTRKLIQTDFNKVYKGPMIPLDNSYSTVIMLKFIDFLALYTCGSSVDVHNWNTSDVSLYRNFYIRPLLGG